MKYSATDVLAALSIKTKLHFQLGVALVAETCSGVQSVVTAEISGEVWLCIGRSMMTPFASVHAVLTDRAVILGVVERCNVFKPSARAVRLWPIWSQPEAATLRCSGSNMTRASPVTTHRSGGHFASEERPCFIMMLPARQIRFGYLRVLINACRLNFHQLHSPATRQAPVTVAVTVPETRSRYQ